MPYHIRYECPVTVKRGKKLFKEKDQVPPGLIDQFNSQLVSDSLYHYDLVNNLKDRNVYVNHVYPGKLSCSPDSGLYVEFDAFIVGFHNNDFTKQIESIGTFIKSQIVGDWGKDGFDCGLVDTYSIEFVPDKFHIVIVNVVDEFYVKDVMDDFNSGVVSDALGFEPDLVKTYEKPKPKVKTKKEKEKSNILNILQDLKDLEKELNINRYKSVSTTR